MIDLPSVYSEVIRWPVRPTRVGRSTCISRATVRRAGRHGAVPMLYDDGKYDGSG
ncbi:MAG TPA: hypothetical protein VHY91_26665 [Pirellulales bacterium]|nr:hypothetical protein [Pirellulales bacterium]